MGPGRVDPLTGAAPAQVIPARHDARFARVFLWYTRRLLAKKFHAVHVAKGTRDLPAAFDAHAGPVVLVLNHAAWWDPLVALVVGHTLLPRRTGIAPIDADQLARFKFFRKLGLFGIDPDHPGAMPALLDYTLAWCKAQPRPTVAITPQGRFADVREPVRIRPGAAALAARLGPAARVLVLTIEYAFWQSQRPEIFLRFAEAAPPASSPPSTPPSTASWHRAIEATMQRSADELARLVIARDPTPFVPLLEQGGSSINPAYDLYLRLRGRSGEIAARRASAGDRTAPHARTQPSHLPTPAGAGGRS